MAGQQRLAVSLKQFCSNNAMEEVNSEWIWVSGLTTSLSWLLNDIYCMLTQPTQPTKINSPTVFVVLIGQVDWYWPWSEECIQRTWVHNISMQNCKFAWCIHRQMLSLLRVCKPSEKNLKAEGEESYSKQDSYYPPLMTSVYVSAVRKAL